MGTTAASEPLSAAAVVGRCPVIKEPQLSGEDLFWLEQRPHEQGRTTLMWQRLHEPPAAALELTPGVWNLRSRVHEYGGGVYAVAGHDLVFVHDGDRCLWHLDLSPLAAGGTAADALPLRRLTPPAAEPAARQFADGLIDRQRRRWLGVLEAGGRDQLVSVPLTGGDPEQLHLCADFGGYASLSPSGRQLAWLEWQQPSMPWERNTLWLAQLNPDGSLQAPQAVAGEAAGQADTALFQPLWITSKPGLETLVVASDSDGTWNLQRRDGPTEAWQRLLPLAAEFGMPQWVYGMRTTAWDGSRLLAICCRDGAWELGEVGLGDAPDWRRLTLPFNDLAALAASRGTVVAVASGPSQGPGLLIVQLADGSWQHIPASPDPCPLAPERISAAEPLWFAGHGGARTHAWYYPPEGGAHPDAPLLVKSHSGPTAMARTGLSLGIQFWTTRGWGVLDVNYGGSSGFGRAYRERLHGLWGVVDVADCAAAAAAVVTSGRAHPQRVAIEGGSAGGFTTLAALCFTDVFRAGACRYGVADLSALATETHRFEAGYLDGLVGPWPAAQATYEQRSPLRHAAQIDCPVIFFQGLQDRVVPPEQTERMAAALRRNGIAVEVHSFADEGHGFRSSVNQITVLEATEAFFRRHLALP